MGTLLPLNFILHWEQFSEISGAREVERVGGDVDDDPVGGRNVGEDAEGEYVVGC